MIITIGTELTDGRVTDTNTAWLARELERLGWRVALAVSVPDDTAEIGRALACAREHDPQLIITAGGLGPTQDDITASAIATALGLKLAEDPQASEMVAQATGAASLLPHQRKQATLPAGSLALKPTGTAPGFVIHATGLPIIALPGVPSELKQMWGEATGSEWLSPLLARAGERRHQAIGFFGAGEPQIGAAVEDALGEARSELEVSICARYGEVILDVAFGEKAKGQVENLMSTMKQSFSDYIYSEGEPVEEVLAALLTGQHLSLAVAESCTGGLLGGAITALSGSSAFFRGGVIAYEDAVKEKLLGVEREALERHGAVSEVVARQMAAGARTACGADLGIGITGVAGPTGGTAEKPVGLVYICAASDALQLAGGFNFPGGREDIRGASVTAALHLLHQLLTKKDPSGS